MIHKIISSVIFFLIITSGIHAQNNECINNFVEISLSGRKTGDIQWQFSTDQSSWTDIENQTTEILNFNIQETGYVRAYIIDNSCDYYSDTVFIEVFPYPSQAEAGEDIVITDDRTSVTLSATTPLIGTGVWTVVSGSGFFADSTDPGTIYTGSPCTDDTLRWTITTPCSSTSDDVVINIKQKATDANAGPDQQFNDGTISVALAANTPEEGHGTGYWSILSGEGGVFADPTDPGTIFTGLPFNDYTLQWTIATSCFDSRDNVQIGFN